MTGPAVPGIVIDVSKWQSSLPSLSGVIGVIARAGIGTKPDEMFDNHIRAARAAGLWVGSYWFNWGDLSVSDQVNAYIAREASVGGVALHVIDWESADGFTASQTADFIRIYQNRTGDPIGLYASESRFRDLGQDWNWIANWSQEPNKNWDMWQYGSFHGVDGNRATQRILNLVGVEPIMDTFAAVGTDQTIPVNNNAKVYNNSDLTGTPIIVSPARSFDYIGVVPDGPRIIRWVNRPGDTSVYPVRNGWAGYVARASCGAPSVEMDSTPYSQSDLDTAEANAAQQAAMAQKELDQAALDAAAAQHTADQEAIDAANAAAAEATAGLAAAAVTERERIASVLAEEEANRVRATAP